MGLKVKKCSKCKEIKAFSEFRKDKQTSTGYASACNTCSIEYHYSRSYGITLEDYDNMLESQHYGCKICGEKCTTGRRLAVDHCHKTGMVRGLLCSECNTGLGKFKDDVNRLNLAAQYLTCSGEWLSPAS